MRPRRHIRALCTAAVLALAGTALADGRVLPLPDADRQELDALLLVRLEYAGKVGPAHTEDTAYYFFAPTVGWLR